MSRIAINVLLVAGLLAGCSKQDEQKPAAPAKSAAPTNSPLQLTIANTAPPGPASAVHSNTTPDPGKIERGYAVRETGNLFLTFPKTWKDSIYRIQNEKLGYDAVRFVPTTTNDFEIMIDFHHPSQQLYGTVDIKAQLARIGQSELTNSVEKALDIREFSGPQISGYYFVLTDKNYSKNRPATNDLPYLTQGSAKLGGMIIGFRLVSSRLSPVQEQTLEMLKTARVEKKP